MTANVITYRGRSAAREVGKALGFDEEQLARLSGLVGHWEWRGANDTMARHFEQAGFDIRHPRIAHYLDLCMRMQDLPRHLGPALRRHGHLRRDVESRRSHRARVHAGPHRCAVG